MVGKGLPPKGEIKDRKSQTKKAIVKSKKNLTKIRVFFGASVAGLLSLNRDSTKPIIKMEESEGVSSIIWYRGKGEKMRNRKKEKKTSLKGIFFESRGRGQSLEEKREEQKTSFRGKQRIGGRKQLPADLGTAKLGRDSALRKGWREERGRKTLYVRLVSKRDGERSS